MRCRKALACRLLNSGAGDSCKRDRDPDQYVCLFTYFLIDQGHAVTLVTTLISGDHNTHTAFVCCNCARFWLLQHFASVSCLKVRTRNLIFNGRFFHRKSAEEVRYTKKLDKVDQYLCTNEFCLQG